MRIGLLIYGSLETVSGGYLYDRKLVEHLQNQGDQVEIISLSPRNYLRHLGDNFSRRLERKLTRLDVDILLEDELNHPSLAWLNRRIKGSVRCPIVGIVHHLRGSEEHPQPFKILYQRVERIYLNRVDGFVFNSQTTRASVERHLNAPRPGVVAYPSASHLRAEIAAEEIEQRASKSSPLQILFLGNVIPRKGLLILLDALHRLPKDTWQLTVVGREVDAGYVQEAQSTIRNSQFASNVRWRGVLTNDELVQTLRAHHVLAVPSTYEGFGIVYLEAAAFGLPSIATTAGAAPEVITHREDGFLVEAGDSRAVADCLLALHEDRELLIRMGLAARSRHLRHTTWEQSGDRIRRFLMSFPVGKEDVSPV